MLRTKAAEKAAANGVRERLYAASSLPADFQPKLLDFCIKRSAVEHLVEPGALVPISLSDKPAAPQQSALFTTPAAKLPINSPELAALSDEQRETARQRLDAITPLLRLAEGKACGFATIDGRQIRSANALAEYLAGMHGVNARTLWKWKRRYETGGADPLAKFKSLADHARRDRGISRSLTAYPKAAEYALIKYLGLAPSQYLEAARQLKLPAENGLDYRMPRYKSERLPITMVYRGIEREWPNWYDATAKPPSYTTIRMFLQGIPDCIVTMTREGMRAYENRCEPHLVRSYAETPANAVWVSDHRLFDVFVYNDDYFPEYVHERYAWMRIWLTSIEDWRSRRILGWAFSKDPSSRSVMAAFRMAATRYGFCQAFHMDNGEDYKLFAKILQENFGIETQHSKPFRPRSKPIESWHSILSKLFDPMAGPAYAGHDAKDRSEDNTLALRQHALWRKGKCAATPLLPATHFLSMFETWVENGYNEVAHGGQDMQGMSPRELYDREYPPLTRQLPDIAQLEPLFWKRESRIVRNSRVQIDDRQFEAADSDTEVSLRLYTGREVRIARNPEDRACALMYDPQAPDYKFLGRLVAPQLVPHSELSQDAVAAMEKANARVRRGLKAVQQSLEKRAQVLGIQSEADVLAAQSGVAIPTPTLSPKLLPATQMPAERQSASALRMAAASAGTASPRVGDTYVEEDVAEILRLANQEQPHA
jgi:transposase InsO family protein